MAASRHFAPLPFPPFRVFLKRSEHRIRRTFLAGRGVEHRIRRTFCFLRDEEHAYLSVLFIQHPDPSIIISRLLSRSRCSPSFTPPTEPEVQQAKAQSHYLPLAANGDSRQIWLLVLALTLGMFLPSSDDEPSFDTHNNYITNGDTIRADSPSLDIGLINITSQLSYLLCQGHRTQQRRLLRLRTAIRLISVGAARRQCQCPRYRHVE